MAWISWNSVRKPKEFGRIRANNVGMFNRSLISKWLWRFIKDGEVIWRGILEVRYGNIIRRILSNDVSRTLCHESLWWRDLMGYSDSLEAGGFTKSLTCRLGDSDHTLFWYARWIMNNPLKSLFLGLFEVSERKFVVVRDMGVGWGWYKIGT